MAEECGECRELLAIQEALFDGLALSEMPSLPDDFSRRVVNEALTHRGRYRVPAALALVLVVAAALLIVLTPVAWFAFYGPAQPGTPDPVVVQPVPGPDESKEHFVVDTPEDNTLDAEAYRGMVDQFALWIQFDAQSVATAARPVTDTLRPITDSVGTALNAMRRTLPAGRPTDPDEPQAGLLPRLSWVA